VLDIEVLTQFYCACIAASIQKREVDHQAKCVSNYEGTSGGTEAAAAVAIFQHSQQGRGVCYSEFLGDGDSKAFISVICSKPYNEKHCEFGMCSPCIKNEHTPS
jgi:hypothetical protein